MSALLGRSLCRNSEIAADKRGFAATAPSRRARRAGGGGGVPSPPPRRSDFLLLSWQRRVRVRMCVCACMCVLALAPARPCALRSVWRAGALERC